MKKDAYQSGNVGPSAVQEGLCNDTKERLCIVCEIS